MPVCCHDGAAAPPADAGDLGISGGAGWRCPFSSSSLSSRCMTRLNICSILGVEDDEDDCCLPFDDGS